MPTEMVAAYPGTARLGLTPDGSHQGQSSPEEGYSKPTGAVTIDRIRMDRAHSFLPRPCSPALRTIPSGALLVHDGDHRPLFLLPRERVGEPR